jgi:hypothetical protein
MAYQTTTDRSQLYQDVPANTLLNDGTYHLPKFQNMHPYMIASDMDIAAHLGTTYPVLPSPPAVPETYLFSKELVAYLETLIAFSCCYRADDSRMAGRMEPFCTQALARYKFYKCPDFHKNIARKMTDWHKAFPWETTKAGVVDSEDEAVEAEAVEEGARAPCQ